MKHLIVSSDRPKYRGTALTSAFGLLALVLAAAGICRLMAYSVAHRSTPSPLPAAAVVAHLDILGGDAYTLLA